MSETPVRGIGHSVRRKEDPAAALAERKRWIAIHKSARQHMKAKYESDV